MSTKRGWLVIILIVVAIGASVYHVFSYWQLEKKLKLTQVESNKLNGELADLREKNNSLAKSLSTEQDRNNNFESQLNNISGTVGTLTKLSQTDPELLKKYSKIYFLSENYIPEGLTKIKEDYLFDPKTELEIHAKVAPYLEKLLMAATQDGVPLKIVSAYRSFETQESLKSKYRVKYGSGANQFSADQGYSEHQLGTTVDFATASTSFNGFEKTQGYKWLVDNAYRFGFVISFPSENDYYIFESWHWRFVGVKLAEKVKQENRYFYSWPQRTIDEYLVYLFD